MNGKRCAEHLNVISLYLEGHSIANSVSLGSRHPPGNDRLVCAQGWGGLWGREWTGNPGGRLSGFCRSSVVPPLPLSELGGLELESGQG